MTDTAEHLKYSSENNFGKGAFECTDLRKMHVNICWFIPEYLLLLLTVNEGLQDQASAPCYLTGLPGTHRASNNSNSKLESLQILPVQPYAQISSWTEFFAKP